MTPIDVVEGILADPQNLANVKRHTTPDVTYVSLNYDNPELKRVMPWCGTGCGPEAIARTFVDVGRYWAVESFDLGTVFGSGPHVAIFGKFTYRSTVLRKRVTTPFAVYAHINDGLCNYLQFMEDTFATTASFRSGGAWLIKSDPDGEEVSV